MPNIRMQKNGEANNNQKLKKVMTYFRRYIYFPRYNLLPFLINELINWRHLKKKLWTSESDTTDISQHKRWKGKISIHKYKVMFLNSLLCLNTALDPKTWLYTLMCIVYFVTTSVTRKYLHIFTGNTSFIEKYKGVVWNCFLIK